MATRLYSLAKGQTEFQVVEAAGSAVTTAAMEFTFDLAQSITREDIVKALDMFKNHILKKSFPPA
jgi:hypothetical protein